MSVLTIVLCLLMSVLICSLFADVSVDMFSVFLMSELTYSPHNCTVCARSVAIG